MTCYYCLSNTNDEYCALDGEDLKKQPDDCGFFEFDTGEEKTN